MLSILMKSCSRDSTEERASGKARKEPGSFISSTVSEGWGSSLRGGDSKM